MQKAKNITKEQLMEEVAALKRKNKELERTVSELRTNHNNSFFDVKLFKTIFDNAPVFIDAFAENGKCVLWNKECQKVFGWSIEELNASKNSLALFYPDDKIREAVEKSILKEPDSTFSKFSPFTKFGHQISTLWANFAISNGLVINIGYDITEREKREEERLAANQQLEANNQQLKANELQLKATNQQLEAYNQQLKASEIAVNESKNRFRAFSEATYEAIFISEKNICLDANTSATQMFGYTLDELIGISAMDVIADESKELVKNNILSGYEKPYDAIAQRKDGSKFFGEFQGKMVNYHGRKTRITAVRDISERKKNEKLLKKRLDFIEFTNKISSRIINIGIDKIDNEIYELLKTTAQFVGVQRGYVFLLSDDNKKIELTHEWCENNTIALRGISDSINIEDYSDFAEALKRDKIIKLNRADIELIPENYSLIDILDTLNIKSFINLPMIVGGKLFGYIGFDSTNKEIEWTKGMIDSFTLCKIIISNTIVRNHSEIELIVAKDQAEESDRLKTAFLQNLSHEIRTPMNGIFGFSELLLEPGLSGSQQQGYIEIIKESGKRMLNTVNDLVDISMIDAGQIPLNISDINIGEQLNDVFCSFEEDAKKKGLKLLLNTTLGSLDKIIIRTDGEKVNTILSNLIKNAIKFSESGVIEFGCYSIVEETSSELLFYVKDMGIGIPKGRQKAIFDRFVQADIEDVNVYEGCGLGLSISKSYVDMLDGKIWVESEDGNGSQFYFSIPYAVEGSYLKPKNSIEEREKKLKIVIAEDETAIINYFKIILESISDDLLFAKNGIEAIELCRKNKDVDLVLMDIKMPEMDGHTATRKIREFNKEIVIIAQTAYALEGNQYEAIESGCNDYITKPINRDILLEKIKTIFKMK